MSRENVGFLLRIPNRRGLGHLMRGLNICRELVALGQPGRILFYGNAPPPPELWDARFEFHTEGEADGYRDWPEAMRSAQPAVVVYDTTLPKEHVWPREPEGPRRAYVMRRWQQGLHAELFAHPLLRRMDAVIVPHSPEEFRCDLPVWLLERACFVGPIVRQPDPVAQEKLRRKYGLAPGDFLLVSTCGGGGFVGQEESFFATVWEVQSRIAPELPNLRHIVVRGPNGRQPLLAPPGVILVDTEPDMVSLLALSDLVIAEGGYNTVNEIRVTRTPAVFLPSPRHRDDQEERVRQLEVRGLARVYGAAEHHRVAADVLALCRRPETLADMRRRYGLERLEIGNRRAAACLAELASWN